MTYADQSIRGLIDMNKRHRKELLGDLKSFATELANAATQPRAKSDPFIPSHAFSTEEYGGLMLSGDEGRRYAGLVRGLLGQMGGAMSENSVRKLVQAAILKTLDLKERHQSIPVGVRADRAINEVQAALSSPHLKWMSCIPILGITPPNRPWTLNNIALIDITRKDGRALLKAADHITDRTTHTDDEKSSFKAETRRRLIDDHPGQAFALVTTLALDAEAAWASAKRQLRFTLDCLNLAVDVLHGYSQHYELSMDEPRRHPYASGLTVNVSDHTSMRHHSEINAPVGTLNAEEFRKQIREHRALKTLCDFLNAEQPNGHQRRVLSAAQWGGRAGAESRAEEAFLFRAIALETLALGDREKTELTQRLALSIVHLLGDALRNRKDAFSKVKMLYGVRSTIVHSGKYEVDQSHSMLLRGFVLRSLLRVLGERVFTKMVGKDDLSDWFDARMRGEGREQRKP